MKNKNAFTLIEILIVVGVVMVIMVSISGIMSGVFTSQNKNKSSDIITQNGSWILNELKKNVLNGQKFECDDINHNSISITSVKDGDKTTISCQGNETDGYNIAFSSAQRSSNINLLNNKELRLTDCDNFVNCTLSNGQLSKVTFSFSLGAGMVGLTSETKKDFLIDVTLRN